MTIEQTINDLLAQLEACTVYVEYMPLRSRCVQALDSYDPSVGVGPNRAAQWERYERICAKVGPLVSKQAFEGIRIYSMAELTALSTPKQKDAA